MDANLLDVSHKLQLSNDFHDHLAHYHSYPPPCQSLEAHGQILYEIELTL